MTAAGPWLKSVADKPRRRILSWQEMLDLPVGTWLRHVDHPVDLVVMHKGGAGQIPILLKVHQTSAALNGWYLVGKLYEEKRAA